LIVDLVFSVGVSGELTHHGSGAFLTSVCYTVSVSAFSCTATVFTFLSLLSTDGHLFLIVFGHFSLVIFVVASTISAELTSAHVFVFRALAFPESDSVREIFTADIAAEHAILIIWRGSVVIEFKVSTNFTLFFFLKDKRFLLHGLDTAVSAVSHFRFVVASGNTFAHPVGFSYSLLLSAFETFDIFIFFVPSGLSTIVEYHLFT
jgi:hypothetical protein